MVEKKEKAEAPKAKAAPKKAAAPKAEVAKEAVAKKIAAPKKETKASAANGKTLTVIQTGSPIGREKSQRATLIGLGLNKIRRTRTLPDTPSIRGMIEQVKHMVKIVD